MHGKIEMKKKVKLLILLFILFGSGCNSALLQTISENEETQQRLKSKSNELDSLNEQTRQLLLEKDKLVSDLSQKSMTLEELNARLEKLKLENSRIQATTDAEQQKKAALTERLTQYLEEINTLNGDPHLSIEAKEKRIKELKQQIREQLNQEF